MSYFHKKYAIRLSWIAFLFYFQPIAFAGNIDAPVFKAGDLWHYKTTDFKAPNKWSQLHVQQIVTRVTSSSIYLSGKPVESPLPAREFIIRNDLGRTAMFNGSEVIVSKPASFPLSDGKTWDINWSENNPNANFKMISNSVQYKVLGMETVTVLAGTFQAMKIEAEGQWRNESLPSITTTNIVKSNSSGTSVASNITSNEEKLNSGRIYRAYWYVPEVKRMVKVIEETYNSSGERMDQLKLELELYKVSN